MRPKPPAPPAPPSPPIYCGPPLPVDIPVEGMSRVVGSPQRSLYHELFGADLSVITMALDAPWSGPDMRELAAQIMTGRRSFNNLSTEDGEVLDAIARAYNDGGRLEKEVQPAVDQRLSLSEDDDPEGGEGEDGEDLSPGPDDDVPGGAPPGFDSDPYSWT